MSSGAVELRSEQPSAVSDSVAFIQMLERVARDPAVDMDRVKAMLDMQERILNRNAEQAFNIAMTAAQTDMGRISADANNPQTKSKYASYGKLDKVLRPIYTKHGFALSFDTGDISPADCVRVVARVSHSDGFTRTYHADMPADGKGAKGGDVMTKTHATGAAMSYGMRYLLKMIFNVAIGEEDRDGNAPDGGTVSEAQVKELLDLIEKSGTEIERFCNFLNVDAVSDVHARDFDRVKRSLLGKIAKKSEFPGDQTFAGQGAA